MKDQSGGIHVPRCQDSSVHSPLRFFLYSHDGLGLGHLRRNLAIAEALSAMAPQSSILLASGAANAVECRFPGNVDCIKLPELRKLQNQQYAARRLAIPGADIILLRSTILYGAVQAFRPDVLLVDKHPLGASGELLPALEELRSNGGRAVLGLRDILDERGIIIEEWFDQNLHQRVPHYYDQVLVYGQKEVFNLAEEYCFPVELTDLMRYCGYVVTRRDHGFTGDTPLLKILNQARLRPMVLATAGGGEDGFFLLETFVRACKGAPWQGVVIAGPMMPDQEVEILQTMCAEMGIFFQPVVSGLKGVLSSCDGLVCMGGYNTLVEAASVGIPTLCVPRCVPRLEQVLRAEGFRKLGLLNTLKAEELTADNLRCGISAMLETRRSGLVGRVRTLLNFEGAFEAASSLLALANASQSAQNGWLDPHADRKVGHAAISRS